MKDYNNNYLDDYRDDDSGQEFLELLAKLYRGDEEGTFVPVEPRIELVKKLFQVTKLIFQEADKAKLEFSTPFHGMGVISLEGRNLKCIMPDYLVSISRAADNIEIYSKLNGCVHFDFCFYGCEVKEQSKDMLVETLSIIPPYSKFLCVLSV